MRLEIVSNDQLTPHMQRLVLTAPELGSFSYQPGQDVMLMVAVDGNRPVRRRYTIRDLDPARQRLTMDIVRHGDGPGESWVRAARPGDTIEGIGPRGKIFPAQDADWHLFAADESGLAAVFAMVSSLPAGTRAIAALEIPEPADEQPLDAKAHVDLRWLPRSAGDGAGAIPRRRPGTAGRRACRRPAAGRPRPRLPVRRGQSRAGAAGDGGQPGPGRGPGIAQGLLGPGQGERVTRRARPGQLGP